MTHSIPKCLVPIDGTPMIDRLVDRLSDAGISELVVVTGYLDDVLEAHLRQSANPLARSARAVYNTRYMDWGNGFSFLCAREATAGEPFVKLDTDLLLDDSVLPAVLGIDAPAVLAVDKRDNLGIEEMKVWMDQTGRIAKVNKTMDPASAAGECAGIDFFTADMAGLVFDELEHMMQAGETNEFYELAYERLMDKGYDFACADITGALWCEIDSHDDLSMAGELCRRQSGEWQVADASKPNAVA